MSKSQVEETNQHDCLQKLIGSIILSALYLTSCLWFIDFCLIVAEIVHKKKLQKQDGKENSSKNIEYVNSSMDNHSIDNDKK